MRIGSVQVTLCVLGVAFVAWGCSTSPYYVAKPEPWRADEERACLASGMVRESPFLHMRSALGGPGEYCGAERPFEMAAADNGRVQLRPVAMLRCPMIPAVERWVQGVVQPAALAHFGVPLSELKIAASYSCRPMNNVNGGRLSEHGHANAVDVSQFVFADGRSVAVRGGWHGDARDRAFLQAVHDGACREFTTVLGPDHDANHHDHFHLDLAKHGRSGFSRYCK